MSSSAKSDHRKSSTRAKNIKRNEELRNHESVCKDTDSLLQVIIASDKHLDYLPPDCTLEQLQAEIALARGTATKIFVKRDGLSTLEVVLPQQDPTIASLKRAIERKTIQLQQRKSSPPRRRSSSQGTRDTPPRRPRNICGDLVAAPAIGRKHRKNASWRFLWRAYALCKAEDAEQTAPTLLPDANGRQLLSDFGIGHKSVLRFVKREIYLGRRRQR